MFRLTGGHQVKQISTSWFCVFWIRSGSVWTNKDGETVSFRGRATCVFDIKRRSKHSHTSKGLFCQEIWHTDHKSWGKGQSSCCLRGFQHHTGHQCWVCFNGGFFLRVCDLDRLCSGRQEMWVMLAMCIETPLPSSHSEMSPLPSEPCVPTRPVCDTVYSLLVER